MHIIEMRSEQKVQSNSPGKLFKQEAWEMLSIMMNGT